MKKIIKISSLILSFCMLLSIATYANDQPESKLLYQSEEITSFDELHKRANLQINDFDISKLPESITKSKYVLKDKNGNINPLDTTITSQLLNQVQTKNGINETYAVTLLATGSLSDEKMDDSISVKAYSTIYFTKESSPDTIILTKASGGWQVNDTSVSVHDRLVRYGTSGLGPTGLVEQVNVNSKRNDTNTCIHSFC